MRHRIAGFKLGRNTAHRKALRRNMALALFTHGQITTTVPKAKSLRPFVEKLISTARSGDLASRRRVIQAIGNPILVDRDLKDSSRKELAAEGYKVNKFHELQDGPRVVKHLFDQIATRFKDRAGGYTRIVRLGKHRIGDAADLCVLQLVGDEQGPQVSGKYSRRRDKANRRAEFAASLRKSTSQTDTVVAQEQEDEVVQAQLDEQTAPQAAGSEADSTTTATDNADQAPDKS